MVVCDESQRHHNVEEVHFRLAFLHVQQLQILVISLDHVFVVVFLRVS